MQSFEVVEAKDGWHVYLSCGRVDVILPSREEAIAFAQACVGDGPSAARSEIEQGDTPLPPLIVVASADDDACEVQVLQARSAAG